MLIVFIGLLGASSAAVSLLNWTALPSDPIAVAVVAALSLGVEGAKLFLVPHGVHLWSTHRKQAVIALGLGILTTLISSAGMAMWLNEKLTFNDQVKAAEQTEHAFRVKQREITLNAAETLVQYDKASKALALLEGLGAEIPKPASTSTTIPIQLSAPARVALLLGVALLVDLTTLFLLTVWQSQRVRPSVPPVTPVETDRLQQVREAVLAGKHGNPVASVKTLSAEYGMRQETVRGILTQLVAENKLEKSPANRFQLLL